MVMWFYDDAAEVEEYQTFRKKALPLEKEHHEVRVALRNAEATLRVDSGNKDLKNRVEELKKRLEELDKQAPWISMDIPLEVLLWGTPHG